MSLRILIKNKIKKKKLQRPLQVMSTPKFINLKEINQEQPANTKSYFSFQTIISFSF